MVKFGKSVQFPKSIIYNFLQSSDHGQCYRQTVKLVGSVRWRGTSIS